MIILGKVLFFGGLLSGLILPYYIVYLCFRHNFKTGILSFFIPFYPVYYIWRRETRNNKLLMIYLTNIILIIVGTIILSF